LVSHGQLFYLLQGRTADLPYPPGPADLHLFPGPAAFHLAHVFKLSNKYMLVIDNILIAIVAVIGLNLVTGFAG
jgi:hypothetical protein